MSTLTEPYFTKRDAEKKPSFQRAFADTLVAGIKGGTAPWHKSNVDPENVPGLPRNGVTGYQYSGASSMRLMMRGESEFFSAKQIRDEGLTRVPNTTATEVQFFGKDNDNNLKVGAQYLYSASCIKELREENEGQQQPRADSQSRHERAEAILQNCGVEIVENSSTRIPRYDHENDEIHLPPRPTSEKGLDRFYDQALTQVVKSTGHPDRDNRPEFGAPRGSNQDTIEVLQNEMTMCFISRDIGLPHNPVRADAYANGMTNFIDRMPYETAKMASNASAVAWKLLEHEREQEHGQNIGSERPQTAQENTPNQQSQGRMDAEQEGGAQQEQTNQNTAEQGRGDTEREGRVQREQANQAPAEQGRGVQNTSAPEAPYKPLTIEEKREVITQSTEKLQEKKAQEATEQRSTLDALKEKVGKLKAPSEQPLFLADKNIELHSGVLKSGKAAVIPGHDAKGELQTVMYGYEDGKSGFAKGTTVKGSMHALGGMDAVKEAEAVIISPNYESAAVIKEATGMPTITSFNSNNLMEAAKAIREEFPDKTIIIAGNDEKHLDEERKNFEKAAAIKTAKAVDGKAVFPTFAANDQTAENKFSSFHDLATKTSQGREAVGDQIKAIVELQKSKEAAKKGKDKDVGKTDTRDKESKEKKEKGKGRE